MTEATGTDGDDYGDRLELQAEAGMRDELGARTLAYRRNLERLAEQTQHELIALAANQHTPEHFRGTDRLARSWRAVREARDVMDAARDALLQHRADKA